MDLWRPDLVLPLAGALLAGVLIGYEREYRGQAAGLRTHTLIALASAMLMLSVRRQAEWAEPLIPLGIVSIDPTRMSHGILTGIGFLCGGVIFKEGLTVHGLTTAGTLWISAALGVLFGAGSYSLAITSTVLTLIVLITFKFFDAHLPGLVLIDATLRYKGEGAPSEADLRTLLTGRGLRVSRMTRRRTAAGLEYSATIKSVGRTSIDDLALALEADGRLMEYTLAPRND